MANGLHFGVHNNSFNNVRRGLLERVFYVEDPLKQLKPAPKPLSYAFKQLRPFARRVAHLVGPKSPIERHEFVNLYQGRRKTIYANANSSLDERPVSRRDAELKTFVKAEKINFTAKPDPAPRVIQPRDPRYNIEVGKYLKPVEHDIYRAVDTLFGGKTILKGYNCDKLGRIISKKWAQFRNPCCLSFDMKRFDQHVSVDALEWEHSVYNRIFRSPELQRLLTFQLHNKGIAQSSNGWIRYSVDGCRMSGDMNTALGNCLIACAITKWLLRGHNFQMINNGDDCAVFFEKEELQTIAGKLEGWIDFGFQCIVEPPVYELEEVVFCQMQPVFDGHSYVMVRDPRVCLSKDAYSVTAWNSVLDAQKWITAVGECGIALSGKIPILQSYYKCLVRIGGGRKGKVKEGVWFLDSGFARLAAMSNRGCGEIDEECRVSFHKAFGINPIDQEALEGYYDSYDPLVDFGPEGLPDLDLLDRWILHKAN